MKKIGLVDVDGHNKVKKWGSAFPNLALMKISAYHKAKGDEVEWALPMVHYDELYMSKIFSISPEPADFYSADVVHRGGVGIQPCRGTSGRNRPYGARLQHLSLDITKRGLRIPYKRMPEQMQVVHSS